MGTEQKWNQFGPIHGETGQDGRLFWVGSDGVGRWVSQELFTTLDEMVRRNREAVEEINKRLENDRFGVVHEVQRFVANLRDIIYNQSPVDEVEDE